MRRQRSTGRLSRHHADLFGRGDVEIGAIARRRRLRNIIAAVFGVASIGMAFWLYSSLAPSGDDDTPVGGEYRVKGQVHRQGLRLRGHDDDHAG